MVNLTDEGGAFPVAQKGQDQLTEATTFKYEYVTSAVSVFKGDGIVVHVVNDSPIDEKVRAVIYQNTGAGARTIADSGVVVVTPSWNWGLGFTIPDSGEYWVRIQATSEYLIPKASFERLDATSTWRPEVTYRPGDFAIFDLTRKRLW